MSFQLQNFTSDRGTINSITNPFSHALHRYNGSQYNNGSNDSLATISASGYFNPIASDLQIYDWIFTTANDEFQIFIVTAVTPDVTLTTL